MSNVFPPAATADPVDPGLRGELEQADAKLRALPGIVRHLLASDDCQLFSDEVIACVRGMLTDLARQLLEGERNAGDFAALRGALATHGALLTHVHALAVEWRLIERMQAEARIDPVQPPLVASLIAGAEPDFAALVRKMVAAQAGFCRARQTMSLPLHELPVELLRGVVAETRAEPRLHAVHDDNDTRLGLLARLIDAMGADEADALSIADAGPALFLSAVAMASGQARQLVTLSTDTTQIARLALCLRAAGMGTSAACEQLLTLHPTAAPPSALLELDPSAAAKVLGRDNPAGAL